MRRSALLLSLALAGCGGVAHELDDAGNEIPDASTDAGPVVDAGEDAGAPEDAGTTIDSGTPDAGPYLPCVGDGVHLGPCVYTLTLDAGAFPPTSAHPSALVYAPANFELAPPLDVIVWLHGFDNCIENIIRDAGESCDPDAGTPARNAYQLVAQLEASNKNALLLAPEIEFDQSSGNPGALATDGGFDRLLAETLAQLSGPLNGATLADIGTVVVASHSGGYDSAAGILSEGHVPVREVWLFDSLYGFETDFDDWVKSDLLGIESVQRRFGSVYTLTGGTLANSQDMADRAVAWVDAGVVNDDRTTDTWAPADYHHGLLFKRSALAHDDVPRYYFLQFLETSTLRDR